MGSAAGARVRRGREDPVSLTYKVVETTEVTDEKLTAILNEWTAQGWTFDSFNFAMRESSRRPQMAFVLFSRPLDAGAAGDGGGGAGEGTPP